MSIDSEELYLTVQPSNLSVNATMQRLGLPGFLSSDQTSAISFEIPALEGRDVINMSLSGRYALTPLLAASTDMSASKKLIAHFSQRYRPTGGIGAYALLTQVSLFAGSGTLISQNANVPQQMVERNVRLANLDPIDLSGGNFFNRNIVQDGQSAAESFQDVFTPFQIPIPLATPERFITDIVGNMNLLLTFANPTDTFVDTASSAVYDSVSGTLKDVSLPILYNNLQPTAGKLFVAPQNDEGGLYSLTATGRLNFLVNMQLNITYARSKSDSNGMMFTAPIVRNSFVPVANGQNQILPYRLFNTTASETTMLLVSYELQNTKTYGRFPYVSWGSTNNKFIIDQQQPISTYPLQSTNIANILAITHSLEEILIRMKQPECLTRFVNEQRGTVTNFVYGNGVAFTNTNIVFTTTLIPPKRFQYDASDFNVKTNSQMQAYFEGQLYYNYPAPSNFNVSNGNFPKQITAYPVIRSMSQYKLPANDVYYHAANAFAKSWMHQPDITSIRLQMGITAPNFFEVKRFFPIPFRDAYVPALPWKPSRLDWNISTQTFQKTVITQTGTAIGKGDAIPNQEIDYYEIHPGCLAAASSPYIPYTVATDPVNPLYAFNGVAYNRTLMMSGNCSAIFSYQDFQAMQVNLITNEESVASSKVPVAGWSVPENMADYRFTAGVIGMSGILSSVSLQFGTGTLHDTSSRAMHSMKHLGLSNDERVRKYLRDGGGLPMTMHRGDNPTVLAEHFYSDSFVPADKSFFINNHDKSNKPWSTWNNDVSAYLLMKDHSTGLNLEHSSVIETLVKYPLLAHTTLTLEFDRSAGYLAHVSAGGGAFSRNIRNPFHHVQLMSHIMERMNGTLQQTSLIRKIVQLNCNLQAASSPRLSLLTTVLPDQQALTNQIYSDARAPEFQIVKLFEEANYLEIDDLFTDHMNALAAAQPKALAADITTVLVPTAYPIQDSIMDYVNKVKTMNMFSTSNINVGGNPIAHVVQRMPGYYDPSHFSIYVPPKVCAFSSYGYGPRSTSLPIVAWNPSVADNVTFTNDLRDTPYSMPQFNGASWNQVNPIWDTHRYMSSFREIFGREPAAVPYHDYYMSKLSDSSSYSQMRTHYNQSGVAIVNKSSTAINNVVTLYTSQFVAIGTPAVTTAIYTPNQNHLTVSGCQDSQLTSRLMTQVSSNKWQFLALDKKTSGATLLQLNYNFMDRTFNKSALTIQNYFTNIRPSPMFAATKTSETTKNLLIRFSLSSDLLNLNLDQSTLEPMTTSLSEILLGLGLANGGTFTEVSYLMNEDTYRRNLHNITQIRATM